MPPASLPGYAYAESPVRTIAVDNAVVISDVVYIDGGADAAPLPVR